MLHLPENVCICLHIRWGSVVHGFQGPALMEQSWGQWWGCGWFKRLLWCACARRYVLCNSCKSPDTLLDRDSATRIMFLRCQQVRTLPHAVTLSSQQYRVPTLFCTASCKLHLAGGGFGQD